MHDSNIIERSDMSGHSKWATTKHHKAIIDAKRGKIFTKYAKLITIAARDGKSGDPSFNPSLRVAIENAKSVSMPKDNIERAIKKGIGGGSAAAIEEVNYEAYAPGGTALLIECLTDNKNRTLGEIKAILNKNGGVLANAGSVSYLFKKLGQIVVDETKNELKGDDLEIVIIDSGADDFEKDDSIYTIICEFSTLHQTRTNLEKAGVVVDSTEVIQRASTFVEQSEEKAESIMTLIAKLEELDDVSSVYCNLDLS